MTNRILAFALVASVMGLPALAQDEGLYPDAAAPDASYLRVYVAGDEAVAVDGRTLEPGPSGLTPFVEIAPGPVAISIDGEETTVEAGPNSSYSFLVVDGEGALITDDITGSPAQADLVFYNLTDLDAVDVFVPSADATALEAVAPGAGAVVALRAPLTLDLELRHAGEAVANVEGVELVRSGGTTVLLTGEAGQYEALAEANAYAD